MDDDFVIKVENVSKKYCKPFGSRYFNLNENISSLNLNNDYEICFIHPTVIDHISLQLLFSGQFDL